MKSCPVNLMRKSGAHSRSVRVKHPLRRLGDTKHMSITTVATSGPDRHVTSNYVWILLSFLWPLVALVPWWRLRRETEALSTYAASHHSYQMRTCRVVLTMFATVSIGFLALAVSDSPYLRVFWIIGIWPSFLVGGWAAARAARGLYLAGGEKPQPSPSTWLI